MSYFPFGPRGYLAYFFLTRNVFRWPVPLGVLEEGARV